MNKKQLQYIKEKRKEGIYVIPTVTMRTHISNTIIEELDIIYNPPIAGLDVEYKSSLNDISLPRDFLDNTYMISAIRKHGSGAMLVYIYLHEKMCNAGYKIEWNEIQQDIIKIALSGMYKMDMASIDHIIATLLESKLLYRVFDGETEYLTSAYQIFIYERVSAKRLRDRIYKRNMSIKKKEDKYKINTQLPAFLEEEDNTKTADSVMTRSDDEMEQIMSEMIQEEIDRANNAPEGTMEDLEDIPFH